MSGYPSKVALAAILVLGGCASVDPSATFTDVAKTTSQRVGGDVRWNRDAKDQTSAKEATARLLESPLSDATAVRIALLNNQRLQAAYEEIGIAQSELVEAGLAENPSISVDILTGNGAISPSFSVVENIFSLVTLSARRTIAASALERTKYAIGATILDTAAEVRETYYKLVADQQVTELLRQVVTATEAAAELAERQARAGNLSRRDQALQQSQYAEAVADLAKAESQLAADREALNRLLGLSGDQITWNLPTRLPDVPSGKPSLEGLETLAIEHRLDLAGARADLQTSSSALELGRQLRWLSVLGLGVTIQRDPESGAWLKGPKIEFTLPIFDQGETRVASLEGHQKRSGKLLAALAVDVRSQIREGYIKLIAAQDAAAFHKATILPLKQQIVTENQRLYNGMLVGVYDLIRSRQDQIAAAREFIGIVRDYWVARASLEKSLAGPVPTDSTKPPPSTEDHS